ncbi:hypothetical protein OH76DRAFT_1410522 [Lentinus brumalis]|uniref:Uncharacterized protein n=1 Tax=Lentinus brumalis TaxID=2498619 RepID=A0A371CS21_9APHY|nr:hypothetical protein OH76DRAFT_1410522 [Polyporus brumalis]
MEHPEDALKAVDAAIAKCKVRERKRLADTSGQVSTHLVLLKLSTISKQLSDKLASFLRDSLRVLYAGVPVPALRLAAVIFESVYHNRILAALGGGQSEQKDLWESVLYALLSGVLDFLDAHQTKAAKDAVGEALFPVLCGICFSLTAPKTGVDLRCTAYNILTDAAASHQVNQGRLRDPKVLGGERLGSCIWRTQDYLPLEGLLNLFARALPSTNNSAGGRAKRTAFIHVAFKNTAPPEAANIARSVTNLLEDVPSSDWEETCLKIVDAFAKGNIAYPQPLAINGLVVHDVTYPSDRLYADGKTFLANVLLGDDQYESLEIPYTSIRKFSLDRAGEGQIRATLDLSMAPRLGKDLIKLEDRDIDRGLNATFLLSTGDANRLTQALDSRGLRDRVSCTPEQPPTKLSLAARPANLEIDSAGRLVEPSQIERIENLSQFYRTDDPSDDIQSAGDFDEFIAAVEVTSQPMNPFASGSQDDQIVDADRLSTTNLGSGNFFEKAPVSATTKSIVLARTGSQVIRDAVFGGSLDDLSEISSECDSPTPRSNMLRRSSTSTSINLVRGRLSFEPVSAQKEAGRVGRGRVGKVILDSDDDSPPPRPPANSRLRPANKLLLREPTADDVLEEFPIASLASVPLEPPLTPPSQQDKNARSSFSGLGPQSASTKVLRFSHAIPAPDFNAALSSPAVATKGVLKSALVKKTLAPAPPADGDLLDSSPPRAPPVQKARAGKPATSKVGDPLYDLIPPSSSPTPGVKRSVKGALRKKGELVSAAKKDPPPSAATASTKSSKRKALADVETDENVPPGAVDNDLARPAKRARTSETTRAPTPPSPIEQEDVKPKLFSDAEAQVLRPAMRARRTYHARKGRTSSPVTGSDAGSKALFVDYDALPSPPRATAAAAASSSVRSTPPRQAKTKAAEARASEAKAAETEADRGAKRARGGKADASETVGKGVKAEKSDKVVKAEKVAKPKTEKTTKPEKPTKPEKSVKTEKAKKSTTQSKVTSETENSASRVLELDELAACAPPPRGPPRPRRLGASTIKDKGKENAKQVETNPESPSRPVRASARAAAAAAEKRRAQEDGQRDVTNDIADCIDAAADPAEAASLDVAEEPPLFGAWQPESDDVGLIESTKTPRVIACAKETKGTHSATKKSSKTPWDTLAEQTVLDDRIAAKIPLLPVADVSGTTIADDASVETSPGSFADVTLVQPPSPIILPKKVVYTSTPKSAVQTTTSTKQSMVESGIDVRDQSLPLRPVLSKPSPITIKCEVETIDLTMDSPPKAPRRPKIEGPRRRSPRLASPPAPPPVVDNTDVEEGIAESDVVPVQQYLPEPPPRPAVRPTVRFVSESLQSTNEAGEGWNDLVQRPPLPQVTKPSLPFSKKQAARRKQEMEEAAAEEDHAAPASVYSSDPCVQRIVEVLFDLNEVLVQSVVNKFEGLREEVRVGRDELLRRAADDLHAMRAESVVNFNRLVDLEAEYATVGRNVIHGTEDWMKVNQEICRELSAAIETHDRSMLSKKMPATLVSLKL